MTSRTLAPNHHAHHPGFSGIAGFGAAVSMLVGRGNDADLACRLVSLSPTDAVVDIGCGPGTAARRAARLGAAVIGVDPAPVMLRVARLVPARGQLTWSTGTAEATGLADASATVVWSLAAVHHWQDLGSGADEVVRLLKPAGRFLALERLTTPGATGHASHGWTPQQAADFGDVLRSRGFEAVEVTIHSLKKRGQVVSVVGRVPSS